MCLRQRTQQYGVNNLIWRNYKMEKSLFEQFGGTYHEESAYLIPDLRLPEEEEQTIGLFGQRHLQYLREYRKVTYTNLLTSGRLNAYLAEIDRQAQGITEQLKAEKALEWT